MKEKRKKPASSLTIPFRDMGGEKLLQFIWQFGYYNSANLTTTEGEAMSVVFPGTLNRDGGPDFTNARIKIGETTFFGTVELHLKTSVWEKHRHGTDTQYRNVVLHVVFEHDKDLPHNIPVLELQPRISTLLLERYNALMNADAFIPCSSSIASVSDLVWVSWKERLLVERLTRKAERLLSQLQESKGHWEETLWWMLARNFGSKVNGDAFEAIAKSIPLTVLAKHRSSIHQVEALLLGQAGLLEGEFDDEYPKLLQREYRYLQKKLFLQPIAIPLQFLRMRPVNFPTIRLAQLAVLLQQLSHLCSKLLEANEITDIKPLFRVTANDFWHYHYTFNQASAFKRKTLGNDAIDNLLINTVVPLLFAYGIHHNEEKVNEKALRWLEQVSFEKNSITSGFANLGINGSSAYDSQAFIQLKNEYCQCRKCLQCAVGNHLLKREALKPAQSPRQASA
jgi:hypothetical protein